MAERSRPLSYTGVGLDRADALRRDPAWLAQQIARADTRLLPVWRNGNLFTSNQAADAPRLVGLPVAANAKLVQRADEVVFLGVGEGVAWFALDLGSFAELEAAQVAGEHQFVDIRLLGSVLPAQEAALAAYARGLLYWHRSHRFCGRCGSATVSEHGGHQRSCAACGRSGYPRTDPAVIMLVEHLPDGGGPARCLLGRQANWPTGVYSTLAGFVEPGESLEEAVQREVREETGIATDNVRYLASQPWPFPSSLMLGFHARARTTQILIDTDEIEDARWFSVAELRDFGDWGDASEGFKVPRRDSIARYLIEQWLAVHSGESG